MAVFRSIALCSLVDTGRRFNILMEEALSSYETSASIYEIRSDMSEDSRGEASM
jgi:hypothetical protein